MRQKLWDLALKVAELSTYEMKHGCVVASGSRIFALGINHSRPRSRKTVHAEVHAIGKLKRETMLGATLYSARVSRAIAGRPMISKPCESCESLIHKCGISKIVYFDGEQVRSEKL